ncbi:MAG TPA: tetratricopeptide repeat protein, partial [Bacteroidales bacterium]|nr:tetratricopeptide repeat protein [Bacteroidales bacterium]
DAGKDDTVKVKLLIQICDSLYRTKPEKTIKYATEALDLSIKLKFRKGEAYAEKSLGMGYYIKADYVKANDHFQKALNIFGLIHDKVGQSNMLSNLGTLYNNKGADAKALDYYLQSLGIAEDIGDTMRILTAQVNIGNIYSNKEVTADTAMEYYKKALALSEKINYSDGIGTSSVNLGDLYFLKGDYDDALMYFERSIKAFKKINSGNLPYTLNYIGKVYAKRKDFANALVYQKEALHLSEKANSKFEIAQVLIALANTYNLEGKTDSALILFENAEKIAGQIGARNEREITYKELAAIYALRKNYKNAYQYQIMASNLKDTINSLSSQKEINNLQTNFAVASAQKEIEILKRDARLREAKGRLQWVVIFFLFLGVVSVSFFLRMLYKANVQKKKVNAALNEANGNLTSALETVSEQKMQIEMAHKVITGGINYARYIQKSVLPKAEQLAASLGDHFVIFKPKETVSGDFYWVYEKEEKVIVVAADCTGHGVPGAFMSMLGITLLNEIVKKNSVSNPAEILDRLRQEVIDSLKQNGDRQEAKDGMDISLCCIDYRNMKMQYAGAVNSLYLIRKTGNAEVGLVHDESYNGSMMIEIKGDQMPIGINDEMKNFSYHEIDICKEDTYYISSDGFHDQFGGPKRKRFSYKRFREALITTKGDNMCDQKIRLERVINDWKGDNDQTDDILVIGFRVN